jgi:hypothetical protein
MRVMLKYFVANSRTTQIAIVCLMCEEKMQILYKNSLIALGAPSQIHRASATCCLSSAAASLSCKTAP